MKTIFYGRNRSFLLKTALLLVAGCLSGCQTPQTQMVTVTASELSQYWVIKDKVINWDLIIQQSSNSQKIDIQFDIDRQGNMTNLEINGFNREPNSVIAQFEAYQFTATVENFTKIPVRVNASLLFNRNSG